jgi:signal transduction histidine kinase
MTEPLRKRPGHDWGPDPGFRPDRSPSEEFPEEILRLVARREHSLLSLMELSNELTVSLDIYGIADLALFNLMGQLGTSKSALWIIPEESRNTQVLLRSHGIRTALAKSIGDLFAPRLIERAVAEEEPILRNEWEDIFAPEALDLIRESGIILFAPVHARGNLHAIIALASPVGQTTYGPVELQVLHASLGMVGVALENTGLYNRLLEKHRQLRVANESLKELDRLKSEFLRNVNHELRTPLTVILAYTQLLADRQDVDTDTGKFLKVILEHGEKLQSLMERLLDFSAISHRNLTANLERQSVASLLRRLYEERLPGVAESLRELSLDLGEDVPPARCDAKRVRQILDVLVDNAVKFTPRGSHISVILRAETEEDRPWVVIRVEDDGPGIPPEKLWALFESFRQGDGSTTREVGGMGVGLALARKLAENMGGTLRAGSRQEGGAVFSLLLPAA